MRGLVSVEDVLYWAIEVSAKEKEKSYDEEVKYFAERFHEFVLNHKKELFMIGDAATEYQNA